MHDAVQTHTQMNKFLSVMVALNLCLFFARGECLLSTEVCNSTVCICYEGCGLLALYLL